MQGMRFLLLSEAGPTNHGVITQRVSEDKYLCTFMRQPQSSRLVTTDEITTWNLFPNDEAMNTFIAALNTEKPKPAPVETEAVAAAVEVAVEAAAAE